MDSMLIANDSEGWAVGFTKSEGVGIMRSARIEVLQRVAHSAIGVYPCACKQSVDSFSRCSTLPTLCNVMIIT